MVDPQLHDDLSLNPVQEETEHFKDKNSKDLTTPLLHVKKYKEEEVEMVDLLSSSVLPSLPATKHGNSVNHVIAEKLQQSVHGITSKVDQVWIATEFS